MNTQKGSAHVFLITGLVIALTGALGFIFWQNFLHKEPTVAKTETVMKTQPKEETVYKTVQINDHTFRYPLNKNNEKILIIPDKSNPALQISYSPIRNYYSYTEEGSYEDCKNYVAGLVNVNTEKDFKDFNLLPRFYGKNTLTEALDDGTVVRVGERDLYLAGPVKQNEVCTDIYESEDTELQNILSDTKNVRLAWLRSLELVE